MQPEDVEVLVSQGEGQRLEFKQSFAEENKAIECLCAFANSVGGTLLFGVRDDGHVVGVTLGQRTLSGFSNNLRQNTQPPLAPTLEEVQLSTEKVVAAQIDSHQPGQLFHAFGKAFIRVGKSNHVMTPDEMRARLLEANVDWSEERDRPRFEVSIGAASRRETEYAPEFKVKQASGKQVRSIEWRVRGPRFAMDWRVAQGSALERTHFTAQFDLTAPPIEDDRVALDEMGFEIRHHWRGKERHELHRWPMSRRVVDARKVLWDAGKPILPPAEWDSPGGPDVQTPAAIELEALPPTDDNHIQLLLKNNGAAQDFVVDVIEFNGIEERQQRYVMKWRGHEAESRTIYSGRDAVLDVAQVTPPVVDPGGVVNAIRRGSFRLFSTSLPGGWDVHVGPSDWIPIRQAAKETDAFEESIALKLRVTGSLGARTARRLKMGFNRPRAGEYAVWATVDEWPEQ